MALSKQSAASLALYMAIAHPGAFDAFVSSLPGAPRVFGSFGFLGDDTSDDGSDDLTADDFSSLDDNTNYENPDGSLQLLSSAGTDMSDTSQLVDDSNINENLRELGVDTSSEPTIVVPGSAADTGNVGVVPGSSADPLSQSVVIDTGTPDLTDVAQSDLNDATTALQSISGSATVHSIGAPAVAAAAQALTSPNALQAIAATTTAYLQNQAAQGEEATALQSQANNINAQLAMAAIDHPATGVVYVAGANGAQVPVLANSSTGVPLVGANGAYIPASTGAGILSAITTSSALVPALVIGGLGLLLLLMLGHHPSGGGSAGGASHAPARRTPKFIEVE